MEFDGAWKLRLSEDERSKTDGAHRELWPPAFLGNGRLGLLVRLSDARGPNVDRALLSLDHEPRHARAARGMPPRRGEGVMFANAVETFGCGTLRLFDRGTEGGVGDGDVRTAYRLVDAQLSMDTGTLSSTYEMVRGDTLMGTIACDVYACRQQPHLVVQSVTVQVRQDAAPSAHEDFLFHEMNAPPGSEQMARFGTSIVLARGGSSGTYVFSGSCLLEPAAFLTAAVHGGGETAAAPLHCSCSSSYLWEKGSADQLGFARDVLRPGRGLNKMLLKDAVAATDAAGNEVREYRFHVYSVLMSHLGVGACARGAAPENESTHALVTIMGRALRTSATPDSAPVYARVRTEHVRAWDAMWATNVFPVPKLGISPAEEARVVRVKRHARYALYNLYASVRGGADVLYTPGLAKGGAAFDLLGNAEGLGELWFLPVMTLLRPDTVRTILDARATDEAVADAEQRAANHGFAGTMFPYDAFAQDPALGTSGTFSADGTGDAAVAWDVAAVVPVFKTAAVGVNVWNYYRISRDKEWLDRKGYVLLSGVADFCASALRSDPSDAGRRVLVESLPFGNAGLRQARHNAFSANACYLALKAAMEASYELRRDVKQEWSDALFDSEGIFFAASLATKNVIKLDDDYEAGESVRVAEPVLCMCATFRQDSFPTFRGHDGSYRRVLTHTRNHYRDAVSSEGSDLAMNVGMFATASGLVAQYLDADTANEVDSELDDFYALLERFVDVSREPVWGNLRSMAVSPSDGRRRDEANNLGLNDIVSSAAYLSVLLNACAGAEIVGGVTNTSFYYEAMKLRLARVRRLPRTWKELRVSKLGVSRIDAVGQTASVRNEMVYTPPP